MSTELPMPAVDSTQRGVYQVFSLCFAIGRSRRTHENFMNRDIADGPMPLNYNLWILRDATRTVLVDTGFGDRVAAERAKPLDRHPVDTLIRLGIDPDSIEDIILTHLHYDHSGNLDRFAKARFHLQEAELTFATGRCMCDAPVRAGFNVEDVVSLVRHTYADRARLYDGDAEPLPGIKLHALPGHTAGMQAVEVMTQRGPIVLASDVSHYYANLLRRAPFAWTLDAKRTLQSYDRLMEIAGGIERVIPGHDPKVQRLYPNHTFAGVELTALHEQPLPHDIEELTRLDNYQ
ncbi:N-acyl homoserine lactonase family protein [Variovorax saccharolyticus]|uniref:N-acyl homoserine lactonase family protein n=1 Tax=Variovorax saccharolyticus TaxID=3053516 RepID=UPI002578AA0C|nr:N-acyl homoserine lactonase family protein [Variovorax sp. J22R187]MDM0021808.1 N-acyl homoserine lactonase family protein [Variovorax sp. J22R187]